MFKSFIALPLTLIGILLTLALAGGLLVLLSYGVGWLLTLILPLSPFEAALLSLLGLASVAVFASRLLQSFLSFPRPESAADDEDQYDDSDELDDEEEEEEEDTGMDRYTSAPRWRSPYAEPDSGTVRPDDRCPCGSGRKFKNCHGRRRKS